MKELIEILQKDIESEDFTLREIVVYGIVAPLAVVAACVLAEVIITL